MRKLYKSLIVCVTITAIIFGLWYLYKRSIENNLETKSQAVEKLWMSLFDESYTRIEIMQKIVNMDTERLKVLSSYVIKNIEQRNQYNKKCEIYFVKLEYDVNEAYLNTLDSIQIVIQNTPIFMELAKNTTMLNESVEKYNDAVWDLNSYYSTFPNFFIAKKTGKTRQEYFEIKYGQHNTDPLIEDKKKQHWIDTGEWE